MMNEVQLSWLALCCFLQTAEDRSDENMKAYQREIKEKEAKERKERTAECAWMEYLERDWEHG
jgi:hypothetical protein